MVRIIRTFSLCKLLIWLSDQGLLGCIKAEVLNLTNDASPQCDLHFWTKGGVFITNNNWPQVFESETDPILKLSTVKKTIEPGPPLRTPDRTETFEEKSRDLNLSANSFQCKIITTRGEQRDIRPAGTYGIVSLIIENLLGEVGNILSRYNKVASVLVGPILLKLWRQLTILRKVKFKTSLTYPSSRP